MMKYLKYIGLLIAAMMLAACGSGGGGGGAGDSSSSGTSSITISVGGSGKAAFIKQEKGTLLAKAEELISIFSPSEAVAGEGPLPLPGCIFFGEEIIPGDANLIVFTITGEGIGSPITRNVPVVNHCETIIETFEVPNGSKSFRADAFNNNGDLVYEGLTNKIINGADFVQIIMEKLCDLFVDDNGSDFSFGTNSCRNANEPCESITHALSRTPGNETICVAEGNYWDTNPNDCCEDFPLMLKSGTRILCEGDDHLAQINVEPGNTGFEGRSNFGKGFIPANGASIIGCRINLLPSDFAQDFPTIGIDDTGADITVDNVIVKGDELPNSKGVLVSGNSSVNNSQLTCSGVDLFIDNNSETRVNAMNNAWDQIDPSTTEPFTFITPDADPAPDPDQPCPEIGEDYCVISGVKPDFSGAQVAEDGCPLPEPEPECEITLSTPEEGETLENACSNPEIPHTWNFAWDSDCGASKYQIEIKQGGTTIHSTSTPDMIFNFSSSTVHSTSTPVEWRVGAIFETIVEIWSAIRNNDVGSEDEACGGY